MQCSPSLYRFSSYFDGHKAELFEGLLCLTEIVDVAVYEALSHLFMPWFLLVRS